MHDTVGLRFDGWIQLPAVLADAGIALGVLWQLLRCAARPSGCGSARRALVMFGPSFLLVSGYHGQIDSLAILPAVGRAARVGARRGAARAVGRAC